MMPAMITHMFLVDLGILVASLRRQLLVAWTPRCMISCALHAASC